LFRKSVAVYCENHTDTVRTSQKIHYVSASEPNRLMPFGETVAVYCENRTEHRYSPYLTASGENLRSWPLHKSLVTDHWSLVTDPCSLVTYHWSLVTSE
jgi:hypothetical protein